MKRSRLWASLLGIVIASALLLVVNLALGNTPVLGLDLRGGVSVILASTEGAGDEDLIVIRDLIRDELEQRGIAEPDVRVEGSNVIVDLPGVKDQQDALDAVDIAGIVSLRPVLQCAVTTDPSSTDPSNTGDDGGSTVVPTASAPPGDSTPTSAVDSSTPTTVAVATTDTVTAATPSGFRRSVPPTDAPTTTTATTTTAVPGSAPATTTPAVAGDSTTPTTVPVVDPNDPAAPGQQDVLPVRGDTGEICVVGPSGGSGEVFERGSAEPTLDQVGAWAVTVNLRSDGEAAWNLLASQCNQGTSSCPSRQLAIVLDDIIQSAPVVNEPFFSGSVQITGSFTEGEARSLARVLNRGAFPVNVEAQSVQTVSPTLGGDSLQAAVVSGIVGAAVIVLFMIAYYRKLAVVIVAGLAVWAMAVYVAAALVSQWTNYAFTLAGATGVIVAVGVTIDSYVVFFERLKDEVRSGRSLRNAAPRSFKATWRTIVSADVVAFLGSAILFWLSVGSVKGFALYLGLTTICDMLVCYFFTRPAVFLLARSGWFDEGPTLGLGATA